MQKHRENMQKYTIGGVTLFALLALLFAPSASAQGPVSTPFPGPALTATAAARGMAAAATQQAAGARMKAEADAARARAAQLEQAGNDAIAIGISAYDSAARDARTADDALNAQQIGVAQEFLARAQSNIDAGRTQINAARESLRQISSMVDALSTNNMSLTNQLLQSQANYTTLQNTYAASTAQQVQDSRANTVKDLYLLLVSVAVILVFAYLISRVLRARYAGPVVTDSEIIDG